MPSRFQLAHTALLDAEVLAAAPALLFEVFAPEMTQEDWEHSLGGLHALVWDGEELIAHAALIQRQLVYEGRAPATSRVSPCTPTTVARATANA